MAARAQQADSATVSPVNRVDSIRVDTLRLKDSARIADSTRVAEIAKINKDSLNAIKAKASMARFQNLLLSNPYYRFRNPALDLRAEPRKTENFEGIFYYLLGLIFFFALIRLIFNKYLDNMVSLFFRVTMRQQQVRDQLLQTPLASLLLNIFFVVSAGTFLAFLARYYHLVDNISIWLLLAYSVGFIAALYTGKYIFLKVVGWLFNVEKATDMYIFIVFLVNKILGIVLIPFIVILALKRSGTQEFFVHLSLILIGFLFLYRFFISYRPVRNEIKVNKFHFFLYLCAFEVTPLVLIYKVLLSIVERGI
jgi:hypothetical protein